MPFIIRFVTKTKQLFVSEQNNILKTSVAMMAIIIVTKASGFLFGALVARELGASRESDLFFIANTIPEILGNFILIGLISAALVPMLVKAKSKDHESFLSLLNSLLNFLMLLFIVVAVVFSIFSDDIFPFVLNTLIRSKFEFSSLEIERAAAMMRLLMIPQIILGVSAFYSSSLNVFHQFLIPQLAPLFYNVGRIVGAYFFIPFIGGAEGLVWGTILGALLHLLIQVPIAYKNGIRHRATINFKDELFQESLKVGGPRVIGIGGEYLANGIDKFIAARFIAGSVTAFDFALRLVSIPLSLFGLTFSVASFPVLTKMYQSGDKEGFSQLLITLLNQIFFFSIPVTVLLLVLRVSMVRLFYGIFGGAFEIEHTYLTAWIVAFFSVGLVFESVRTLIFRAFYATGDTIRPLYAALFTMVLGVVSAILFTNYFSHFDVFEFTQLEWNPAYFLSSGEGKAAVGGLALSSSVVFTLEFILLLFMMHKSAVEIDIRELLIRSLKKVIAGCVMGFVMFMIFKGWGRTELQTRTFYLILLVSLTSISGLVTYLLAAYVLKIREFDLVITFFNRFKPKDIYTSYKKQTVVEITPND